MRGLVLMPLLLAACGNTQPWPPGSYAEKVSAQTGVTLGREVAGYVATTLPPGSAVHVARAGTDDQVASVASPILSQSGYTNDTQAHEVTYVAQPVDGGMMLRVSIDNAQGASKFFSVDQTGGLASAGPLTVTP
jgi:hypothetical protein